MTIDQDRGAYAPHMDAPLAFDARRPTDRRPLPMTLIASGGVLVLIVGALAMAYRGGVRGSDAPRIVGEPVGAIKTAAAPEAGSDAAVDSKMDVYAAQNVPSQPPAFAPPPEAPKARAIPAPAPAPAPASQTASSPPAATAKPGLQVRTVEPVKVRIGEPETTAVPVLTAADRQAAATSRTAITPGAADRAPPPTVRPVAIAQAAPPAAPPATSTKATKHDVATAAKSIPTAASPAKTTRTLASDDSAPSAAKAARTAKADAAAKAKASGVARADADADAAPTKSDAAKPGAAAVQVGAFSSADLAQKGFADAGRLSSLGGHARSVEKVSRDGKTFYRATLGGFADKAAARAFCARLTAKGGRCLVKS